MGFLSIVDGLTFDIFDFDASKVEDATNEASSILRRSADQNIALQEEQQSKISDLTDPFRSAGRDVALPSLSALAFGGEVDFQPSKLFERQVEQGRDNIIQNRTGGNLKSSRTFENLADLVTGAASQDIGRFEQGQNTLLNSGQRAENVLRGVETGTAQRIGSIFNNLGQGLNNQKQQLAQAQDAGAQSFSNTLGGLAKFLLL